jgi:energy-coupling factor transporter ATP-binding protein EcfA2
VVDLALDAIHFGYPGGAAVFAGLTLSIREGPVALVGENGAGKTTLTKLLNGLLRPQAGAVTVAGVAVAEKTVAQMARLIGYAFQNPDDQLFERTVRDEVAFGPRAMHRSPPEVNAAVDRALERCGLSAQAAIHPHDLGLPDRKWVTIASALAADPPVIVLDEPTLGQDWPARVRLRSLVGSLAAEGRLVIVVTHDMDFVADTCPFTVVLTQGQVRHAGPTADAFVHATLVAEAGLEFPVSARLARELGAPRPIIGEQAFASWWQSR